MRFIFTTKTAFVALRTNASRSLLTILGIVIGVSAIILVVSLGAGAESIIVGELGGLGAETIVVRPGKEPSGPSDFAELLFTDSLKERELQALLKPANVPDVISGAPEVLVTGSISYQGETFKPLILGFTADFMLRVLNLRLAEGVAFDERDIASKARVAIIGSRVQEELFAGESAVGKMVTVKGQKFRVVGVFEQRGQVVFFDVDELVLVPYTTAHAYLSGIDHFNQIILQARSPEHVNRAVFDIQQTLRELHRIDDPEKDDFYVQTQQGLVAQVKTILGIFTLFLSRVVAIALVVGGIGVMNIMLVSVTERTREIGLRKALGARTRDILYQFLTESILLSLAGGITGILIGVALSLVASVVVTQTTAFALPFTFPLGAALLGIGVSTLVGVFFGLYPAFKASKKSPIEALRYE